jgi:hypothetical protein
MFPGSDYADVNARISPAGYGTQARTHSVGVHDGKGTMAHYSASSTNCSKLLILCAICFAAAIYILDLRSTGHLHQACIVFYPGDS